MQVTVSNNIRIRGATTPQRATITKALTEPNPEYVKRKQRGRSTWGVDPSIKHYVQDLGDIVVPRGFESELQALVGKGPGVNWSHIQTEGRPIDFGAWNPDIIPRSYQHAGIEACKHDNGILVAPAGAGKTLMGCRIIHDIGRPTIWLTHTKDLMYQSKKNAEKYLTDVGQVGIIGDGMIDWGTGKLIIATLQTLTQQPQIIDRLNDLIGLVVVDEAHHLPANMFIDVIAKWKAKRIIGLTATPDRKDGLERIMYLGVGPKLYEIDRSVLYDHGFLIKPSLQFIYTDFDFEQASDRQGNNVDAGGEDLDYNELINVLTNDEDRAELIARTIIDNFRQGRDYAIALSENTRYCFKIRDKILEIFEKENRGPAPRMSVVHGGLQRYAWRACAGESHAKKLVEVGQALEYRPKRKGKGFEVKVVQYNDKEFNDWQVTGKQRKEIIKAAEHKEVDILFATQLAREGLDLPHLNQEYLLTPKRGDASGSKNGAALEQEVGRVQRRDPGNPDKKAVIFDFVDYEVGVFKSQYNSRRSVYRRLGIKVPNKPKSEAQKASELLDRLPLF